MRVQDNDTVTLGPLSERIGIVELVDGAVVKVRLPFDGNRREELPRGDVRPLAEALAERRSRASNLWQGVSLTGESTLAELVAAFGYATQRLRQESLERVVRQLRRAGLEVVPLTGGWGRDDRFRLDLVEGQAEPTAAATPSQPGSLVPVALPEPFWPTAFGLTPDRELHFV